MPSTGSAGGCGASAAGWPGEPVSSPAAVRRATRVASQNRRISAASKAISNAAATPVTHSRPYAPVKAAIRGATISTAISNSMPLIRLSRIRRRCRAAASRPAAPAADPATSSSSAWLSTGARALARRARAFSVSAPLT